MKTALWFPCASCGQSVCHTKGPHILDEGTMLFCPKCGAAITVHFVLQSAQQGVAPDADSGTVSNVDKT